MDFVVFVNPVIVASRNSSRQVSRRRDVRIFRSRKWLISLRVEQHGDKLPVLFRPPPHRLPSITFRRHRLALEIPFFGVSPRLKWNAPVMFVAFVVGRFGQLRLEFGSSLFWLRDSALP